MSFVITCDPRNRILGQYSSEENGTDECLKMMSYSRNELLGSVQKDLWLRPTPFGAAFLTLLYLRKEIEIIAAAQSPDTMLFDVGCGWMPYRKLFEIKAYLGFDLKKHGTTNLTLIEDGKIPLETGSMDVCVSWQVLEHVEDLEAFFSEIKRCLKPGGNLYLTTHGFFRIHAEADYWRWTKNGLRRLIENMGMVNVQVGEIDNSLVAGIAFINATIEKLIPEKRGLRRKIVKLICMGIIILNNMIGYSLARLLDGLGVEKHKSDPAGYLVTCNNP